MNIATSEYNTTERNRIPIGNCGCGESGRYFVGEQIACNPDARCPGYEELREENAKVKKALIEYHHALDTRQHGDVAANKFTHRVAEILDLHWRQGATLK